MIANCACAFICVMMITANLRVKCKFAYYFSRFTPISMNPSANCQQSAISKQLERSVCVLTISERENDARCVRCECSNSNDWYGKNRKKNQTKFNGLRLWVVLVVVCVLVGATTSRALAWVRIRWKSVQVTYNVVGLDRTGTHRRPISSYNVYRLVTALFSLLSYVWICCTRTVVHSRSPLPPSLHTVFCLSAVCSQS